MNKIILKEKLDLELSLFSGQAFRWEKKLDWYYGFIDNKFLKLRVKNNFLEYVCSEDLVAQNKIYDFYGNFIGWRPIVQFDYTETQDTSRCIYENSFGCMDGVRREEISGLDPMAPRINLGSNSGLQHSFIDSNVVDGFEYTYSVTSYDMGLRTYIHTYIPIIGSDSLYQDSTEWSPSNPAHGLFGPDSLPVYGAYKSLECTIGSSDAAPNFVSIIPGYKASNITFPDIEKAEELAKKYDSDMLVFFFRNGCPDCKKMKAETLKNSEIIKLINENFFPVMLNARTKDTLIFNGKEYINQQPKEDGKTWRNDLYH